LALANPLLQNWGHFIQSHAMMPAIDHCARGALSICVGPQIKLKETP
jgi:hypothetical protein